MRKFVIRNPYLRDPRGNRLREKSGKNHQKLSTNISIRSNVCESRVISVFAATIEPTGHHKLTHEASWKVAFGARGEVVLDDDDDIYLYEHDGVEYRARKTRMPDGVVVPCNKAVSDTTIFIQHWHDDSPTHQLHIKDLHHMGRLDQEGELCGMIYPSTLVYRQRRDRDDYMITLHQPNEEMILQPPPGRKWDWRLSVCRAGEWIVVVEYITQTMDVFSLSGNILLLFCHLNESVISLIFVPGLIIDYCRCQQNHLYNQLVGNSDHCD